MPFVQEAATAAASTEVVSGAKPGEVANEKPSDAKTSVATETKAESKTDASPELKAEAKPGVTITKSETVITPLAPKAPSDAIWLFTWLPLVVMMGLWFYVRGRNKAAERARAEALLAASTKKSKKSTRSQTVVSDDASGAISQVASERIGKGNSKKNKKDKQQQKKKLQLNSGAASSKAQSASAGTSAAVTSRPSLNAEAVALAKREPLNTEATALGQREALATEGTTASERKKTVPAIQPPKAIFEPLRKVTASSRTEEANADVEVDASDEQDEFTDRKRRPSPPPPVVTTPTKVSSGRFEKLNSPVASSSASANRWPVEATRPIATIRTPQPTSAPRTNPSTLVEASKSAPAPITGRGLGAFVKLAKPNPTESQTADSAEVENESSST